MHRIEMTAHGMNYQTVASSVLGLHSLIAIDGDGVDSDNDGKPDAKINPDRIKIDSRGGIYLNKFSIFSNFHIRLLATLLALRMPTNLSSSILRIVISTLTIGSMDARLARSGTKS